MNAQRLRRIEAIAAVLLTAVVILAHANHLRHGGALWRDEVGALNLAQLPTFSAVFAAFPHEAFPLVFPLTVRSFTALAGDSDLAIRCFGFAVGLLELLAFWLAARWARRGPPLAAVTLVGFNAAVLLFGDSLRGYGLGSALAVLTFGLVAQALIRPRRGTLITALVAGLLAAHTLFSNAPLLLAIGLAGAAVAWRRGDRRLARQLLLGGAFIAATLLIYLPGLLAARDWDVVARSPLPELVWWPGLRGALAPGPAALAWGWCGALGLALGMGVLTARRPSGQHAESLTLLAALTGVIATGATVAFLWCLRYDPRPWYFVPLLALAALGLDLLIHGGVPAPPEAEGSPGPATAPAVVSGPALSLRLTRIAGSCTLAILVGPSLFRASTVRYTNLDALARIVTESADSGDLVLVYPWFNGVSFARYYQGRAAWETVPPIADHRFHRYDLFKTVMSSPRPLDRLFSELEATLRSGHRVWLVGGLHLAHRGASVTPLPPAPAGRYGWFDVPYIENWSAQLGSYLQARASTWQGVRLEGGDPINPYERAPLLIASGWATSSVAPSATSDRPSSHPP